MILLLIIGLLIYCEVCASMYMFYSTLIIKDYEFITWAILIYIYF